VENTIYGKSYSIRVQGTYSIPAPETDFTHLVPYYGNGYTEGFWEYSFGYRDFYDDNNNLVCRIKKEVSQRHLDKIPCTDHVIGGI